MIFTFSLSFLFFYCSHVIYIYSSSTPLPPSLPPSRISPDTDATAAGGGGKWGVLEANDEEGERAAVASTGGGQGQGLLDDVLVAAAAAPKVKTRYLVVKNVPPTNASGACVTCVMCVMWACYYGTTVMCVYIDVCVCAFVCLCVCVCL